MDRQKEVNVGDRKFDERLSFSENSWIYRVVIRTMSRPFPWEIWEATTGKVAVKVWRESSTVIVIVRIETTFKMTRVAKYDYETSFEKEIPKEYLTAAHPDEDVLVKLVKEANEIAKVASIHVQ